MYADIEQLVLSGELFNGPARSSSPRRSPSPDSGWHDDELEQLNDEKTPPYQQQESIGMGPGRTGVKGVIRDRDEANAISRSKRALEIEELNKRMEKASLGGKTFLEEERELKKEKAGLEGDLSDLKMDVFGRPRGGKFGHLREVGIEGFLPAVEQAENGVWVVVHIYEPSLERCYLLDEKLSKLARAHPDTKFIHARAATLGFALKTSAPKATPFRRGALRKVVEDEEDPYDDGQGDDETENFDEDDDLVDRVDLDMLPTMLVYRNGELVHNWVRVDWEAGRNTIQELLAKHRILSSIAPQGDNCGLPSDDEEDLMWSDEEK